MKRIAMERILSCPCMKFASVDGEIRGALKTLWLIMAR